MVQFLGPPVARPGSTYAGPRPTPNRSSKAPALPTVPTWANAWWNRATRTKPPKVASPHRAQPDAFRPTQSARAFAGMISGPYYRPLANGLHDASTVGPGIAGGIGYAASTAPGSSRRQLLPIRERTR